MAGSRWKFVLIGVAMLSATALLVAAGLRGDGFLYYVTVSEYLDGTSTSTSTSTEGFRVNGKVVIGTIDRFPSGEDVAFEMSDGLRTMPVRYHGVIPDTFVDDADVVVQGSLGADGVFVAHEMLAKCPSKYESGDGYEDGGEGYAPEGYAPEADATSADTAQLTGSPD